MKTSYLYPNGIRVRYLTWGNPAARQPVILLHGLASNARIWELTAEHLEAHDCYLVAPDARSHGLTDGPDGDYGFTTFFEDIVDFIRILGFERPILIGHSWGAHRVLDYAARISYGPHAPAGIVLVDGGIGQLNQTVPGYSPPTWEAVLARLTPPRLAGTPLKEFLNRIETTIKTWNPNPQLHDQIVSIILANFSVYLNENSGFECIAPHLPFERHLQIVRSLWEFQANERYSKIRCPVLMLPARIQSPQTPTDKAFLASKEYGISQAARSIKDLQVYWFEDTIHDVPLQRPVELSTVLAQFFLNIKNQ